MASRKTSKTPKGSKTSNQEQPESPNLPVVVKNLDYELYDGSDRKADGDLLGFQGFINSKEQFFDYLLPNGVKVIADGDEDKLLILGNGTIISFCVDNLPLKEINSRLKNEAKKGYYPVCGVIVGNTIINNGDTNDDWPQEVSPLTRYSSDGSSIHRLEGYNFVTVSFSTISNLFGIGDSEGQYKKEVLVAEAFSSAKIVLRDFCEEKVYGLTSKQMDSRQQYLKLMLQKKTDDASLKKMEKLAKDFSPPAGFMLVDNSFHQAATVLIDNLENKETGLFGMDENSYFGVVLPKMVKTVTQAYDVLIPDDAKGLDYERQGEWFFVCVPKENQLELSKEAEQIGYPVVNMVTLPLESMESNPHVLTFVDDVSDRLELMDGWADDDQRQKSREMFNYTNFIMRQVGGNRNKSPKLEMYARMFDCYHSDHQPICHSENPLWFKIVRNTAVRSVSSERMVD